MKEVFMGILGIIIYLLIPAIFGGIGAGVYFGIIRPYHEAGKILKNGVETTATIISVKSNVTVSSSSGNTTREERYYYLKLSFVNSEGDKMEYKTRSIYPAGFIRNYDIKNGGTVQAMYVGDKAVVKGYVPKYEKWLWLFPVVFGAIAAGFLIFLVIGFLWTADDYIIKKFGAPATATYLEQKKLACDDTGLNSIICTFVKDNGDTVEVKTCFIYNNLEAEELAKMGSFPIMYKGKKAVIMIQKTAMNSNHKRNSP